MKKVFSLFNNLTTITLSSILLLVFTGIGPAVIWYTVKMPKWPLVILMLIPIFFWCLLFSGFVRVIKARRKYFSYSLLAKYIVVSFFLLITFVFGVGLLIMICTS